jgi:hypothetical protein
MSDSPSASGGGSAADSSKFEMKDVVSSLTQLTEVMQKMAIQFSAVEEKVRVIENKSESAWRDGGEFSPGLRPSISSSLSSAVNQDAGTKLERPKFVVKLSKTTDGVKKEFIRDSDFLDYFEDFEHYVSTWENLPMNLERNLKYPNKSRIALVSLPIKYAQWLCTKLKVAFNTNFNGFKTPQQVRDTVFWQELSTADVRLRIGVKFEEEISDYGAVEILKRIKFNSQFGLIDAQAFADFQHELKKEVMRIQAGGHLMINKINLKDILIAALPDKFYQRELFTKYGPIGSLIIPTEDFAIDLIFDEVELRITSVTKQGLRAVVNKSTREREAQFLKTPTHGKAVAVHNIEVEEMIAEQVNAAMAGDRKCKKAGIGSDGLVLCRWLGGKGACCFDHPASELTLRGKGVSKDTPKPDWLNTGKKAFQAFQVSEQEEDSFYDSFQSVECGNGGGTADATDEFCEE